MLSTIQLTIDGVNVRPDTVPLSDLLDVLNKFNAALCATARHAGMASGDIHISLVGVQSGSNTLVLSTDTQTHSHAQRIVEAVEGSDPTQLPSEAQNSLRDLWKKAAKRNWDIGIQRSNGSTRIATIRPDRALFQQALARGATAFVVRVIRVGGEGKLTANIRLPDGQKLTASVASREVAEQLGSLLFKHVEVRGDAVWATTDWCIREFTIREVGEYTEETSNPVAALDDLAEASQGFWDTVDPTAYIREQRSE